MAYRKIKAMPDAKKLTMLTNLLSPFGYRYVPETDLISTHNNAWQREAGYTSFFDKSALRLHMYIDALPVYFNYHGRTWLIELWKGQYGINTGAEIGIYYADKILPEADYSSAHFHAVSDSQCLPVSLTLFRDREPIAAISGITWWLTVFLVGTYSRPSQLAVKAIITFPDLEMQRSFLRALIKTGFSQSGILRRGDEVHLLYGDEYTPKNTGSEKNSSFYRFRLGYVKLCNYFFCRMYGRITRSFRNTMDKILYLYKLLPFTLRRMLKRLQKRS